MNPISKDTNKNERETSFENLPHNFFIIYELEGKRDKGWGETHLLQKQETNAGL